MREIPKTLLACLIVLSGLSSFSQITQSSQPRVYEDKGDELIQMAGQKIRSFSTMNLDFTYEMENQHQNIKEKMSGKLVSKGEKYHMRVGDNVFISDGTTIWAYMEDLDEVHISLAENTDGAMTPTAILEEFGNQFKATFIKQEQFQGKLVDIVDMVPHAPQVFYKYRVAINASNSMLVYATAHDRHGGTYTYTITKVETNTPVSDNLFTFSIFDFPGVEVIDLR